MKDKFVLPKKWAVGGTVQNADILKNYFVQFDVHNMDWDYHYGFFFLQDGECKYSSSITKPYERITFKQFQQYVLKTKPIKQKKQNYNYLIPILKKYNVI